MADSSAAAAGSSCCREQEQRIRSKSAEQSRFERRMSRNSSAELATEGGRDGEVRGSGRGDGSGGDGGEIDRDMCAQEKESCRPRRSNRERPASAEVPSREHRRTRRRDLENTSRSTLEDVSPQVAEGPAIWQRPRGDAGANMQKQSEREPEWKAEAAERGVRLPRSRRPKSAYPRLEDQVRSCGGNNSGEMTGFGHSTNGGGGDRLRTGRTRSRSAKMSREMEMPAMSAIGADDELASRQNTRTGNRAADKEVAAVGYPAQAPSSVVQARKRNSRSDRPKRARARSVPEGDTSAGTEFEGRSPLGDRKRRQSSTMTPPHAGADDQREGSAAGQVCSTVLLNEPQLEDREGEARGGGEYIADCMASSQRTEVPSIVHTRESKASQDGVSRSDGVCDGRDAKVYEGEERQRAEGAERPAELPADGRDATPSSAKPTNSAETHVEVGEDCNALENTMAADVGTTSTTSPVKYTDIDSEAMDNSTQELAATTTMRQPTDGSTPQGPQNTDHDGPESLRDSHRGALWIEDQRVVERVQDSTSKEVTKGESEVGEAGQAVREWSSSQSNVDGVSRSSEVR